MKYFRFKMIELLYLLKDLFYLGLVEPIVEFLKAVKTIIVELINILVDAPFLKTYHEFVCFGLTATTNIFITEKSTIFYKEKTEELEKILAEIYELNVK